MSLPKWVAPAAKIGAGVVVLGAFSGLIVNAAVSLLTIGIAWVAGIAFINLTPIFSTEMTNLKFKGIRWAVKRNPVETRRAIHHTRTQALNNFYDEIDKFSGSVEVFRLKADSFATQYPAEAHKFRSQLADMEELLGIRMQTYTEAKADIDKFSVEIEKAQAIWDMHLASADLERAAGMTPSDPYERIKLETSIDAVEEATALSLSRLKMAVLQERGNIQKPSAPAQSALQNNPSPVIDMGTVVELQQPVPIESKRRPF